MWRKATCATVAPAVCVEKKEKKKLMFLSNEITALLRRGAADPAATDRSASDDLSDETTVSSQRTCDVCYVLFLEAGDQDDPTWGWGEWAIDRAIRIFSPTPTIAHVELLVPPIPDSAGGKVHFATYLGASGANWQNNPDDKTDEGVDYYLVANGVNWRCLPVFASDISNSIRVACDANIHSPYSLSMYPTSAQPLRKLAWIWRDEPKHMGHCATITSRVLKEAGAGYALPHSSAWYSPGSLYHAINASLSTRLDKRERSSLNTVEPEVCSETIEALLRGPLSYQVVRGLGDAKCVDAIRALTMRVVAAAEKSEEDPVGARVAQKELASALLRWALLRVDAAKTD